MSSIRVLPWSGPTNTRYPDVRNSDPIQSKVKGNPAGVAPVLSGGKPQRRLTERWGRLHAGRSGLGAASTLVLIWAALG